MAIKMSPKSKTGRVMPDAEREQLMDQIDQEKAFQASLGRELPDNGSLGAMSEAGALGVDKRKIGKRVGNMNRAILEQQAPELRGAARNAAVARHRILESSLPERLMTKFDQDQFPRHGHDYSIAVSRAKKEIGDATVQKDIAEYRRLGRSLFPDDPDKASIERLRKLR